MDQNSLFMMIIVIIAFAGMMWWQSRNSKKRQDAQRDFRESLKPGTEVITIGGVIGKVVSVDTKYEEIVIDSEHSLLRFTLASISKRYERPAYIDDDEVEDEVIDSPDDDVDTAVDADVDVEVIDEHETDTDIEDVDAQISPFSDKHAATQTPW